MGIAMEQGTVLCSRYRWNREKKAIKYTNIVLTLILILFGIIDVVNDTSIFDYVYLGYVLTVTVVTLVALIVEKRKRKI